MSRKSQRKKSRAQLVEAMKSYTEFPWDYSYFKWQDIPVDVRRELLMNASMFGRCWVYGQTSYQRDVPKYAARRLYNENWDGCRDFWKACYRARKHPGASPPPRYAQTKIIGWFSGMYMEVESPPASENAVEPTPPPKTEQQVTKPIDPVIAEYERQYREREQAEHDEFNRRQEQTYQTWLRIRRLPKKSKDESSEQEPPA